MGLLARSLLFLFAFFSIYVCALAQVEQKAAGTGVVSGRIVVGDKPGQGIVVVASMGDFGPQRREVARSTTDYEGNYRLMGLPAGRYSISPVAPNMIGPSDNMYGGMGRSVIISEAESIDKIDFTLMRGGVITGRVTDAEGKPVIEERIQLTPVDNSARMRMGGMMNPFMFQTDDRGVYRIYGIPPGSYLLSVGVSPQDGMVRVGAVTRTYFPRTFYPNETDSKKATPIDVPEGAEIKDIDIKLGQRSQAFTVAGRVVDADTGKPVSNVIIGYGTYNPSDRRIGAFGFGDTRTDERGQFLLNGVVPGSFAAFVWSDTEIYSEPAPFQVTDANITGLEIKVRRGATISGTAQIEGTSDRRVLARLSQIALGVSVQTRGPGLPGLRPTSINPDGSFRLTGLAPGRASLFISGNPPPKDLRLVRVERDGVAQPQGIEIAPGAEITGVRLIFEYGSGTVRGMVRAKEGDIPEGTRLFISLHKPGEDPNARPLAYTQADTRGRFLLEGIAAGEYQITLRAMFPPMVGRARPVTVRQTVTVANGVETEATLTFDMNEKEPEVKQP